MSDIVLRLRAWVYAVDAVSASDLMDEAAGEIERLRRQVSSQENFTLTDEEREALNRGIDALCGVEDVSDGACSKDDAAARTLLALLKRLK